MRSGLDCSERRAIAINVRGFSRSGESARNSAEPHGRSSTFATDRQQKSMAVASSPLHQQLHMSDPLLRTRACVSVRAFACMCMSVCPFEH
jgi:hypothetical protein